MTLSVVLILSGSVFAQWPTWQGPTRDSKSPDTGLLKEWPADGPKLAWKVDNIGRGFSGVAVNDGIVYITGDLEGTLTLFAFDLSGKPLWKVAHGSGYNKESNFPGSRSTPTIDSGKLYLLSGVGLLGCFDAKTGEQKWTKDLVKDFGGREPNWGFAESVLIYKDWAIVTPGGKNTIVALNKNTGETVWMSKGFDGAAQYGSTIAIEFEGTPIIVAGTHGGIVGVDARTGETLFSNDFCARNTANCPTPAYADGYLFWSNGYGKGSICLKLKKEGDKVGADVAYKTTDMVCHHGGYIIKDGLVYGNHNNGWTCLDLKTGQKKWFDKGVGKGSLCYADGMLYLFSETKGLMGLAAFSPEGMQMKGQFSVAGNGPSWAHPVIINGKMYLRYDSNLYCFDVKG
jgi:outer membrane protein assembly factor BamB